MLSAGTAAAATGGEVSRTIIFSTVPSYVKLALLPISFNAGLHYYWVRCVNDER